MNAGLISLALLMAAATYPSRALLLILPNAIVVPASVVAILRLVAPAVLAAVAAVAVAVTLDNDGQPALRIGPEWAAVALCVAIVLATRRLVLGVAAAAMFIVLVRVVSGGP